MKKITIIDGYSLLFRAYFATAFPGVEIMRNQDGIPTNAIFAFSNMLNKIINGLKDDDALFVALDTKGVTFRKETLDTYKANRKPAPEDLKVQFPIVRDFLSALGVYQFEKEGFEGDDIAGSVAKLAEKEGYEVTIYTSDRDYLQLVDDNITVNIIRKGLSDVVPMTPSLVEETYGFKPLQIIDYKGLRGDPSDNLPGIPGVGEKTAVKLIQEYETFDNIIAHASDIKGKLGETIALNKDLGTLSRDLAIIKTDIELPFDVNDTIYKGYDFDEINKFCLKYGLKQFMNKVPSKWKKKSLNEVNFEVTTIESINNIELSKDIGIAIDLDGNYAKDNIYGLAIYDGVNHYYINLDDLKKDKKLISILEDETVKKYCFDFKAIKVNLAKYGIDIKGAYFDILLAGYLIDSSLSNDVNALFSVFGVDVTSEEQISLLTQRNCSKCSKIAYFSKELSTKLFNDLDKIEARKIYDEIELPLTYALAEMEIEGFPLDIKVLDELGSTFKVKLDSIAKEIYEMAGEEFNLSSPRQIGDILFNKLGLSSNKKMSTSFDALKEIAGEHEIVNKILEYRKYFKLISTYVDGLKPHVHDDNKIHAHFNQALTTTGRLSSSEPNLQNISVRDEEGKLIRKAFYYPENDIEILSLDYSQIELRILAYLSNCKPLIDIFLSNEDIHSATAKKLFNLEGEPTANQRRRAKTVNFGIIYGISDWGLADQLGIGVKEAKEIINSFYNSFPEIGEFFTSIVNEAKKNGYVSTLTGRRRYLREIYDSNYQTREFAKRAAMNAPIQGTAADLIKIAMIKVNKAIKDRNLKSKMVLQIHDELIFKVYKDEKETLFNLVKQEMEHALELSVPLQVDGGFGKDWYSAK